MKVVRCQIYGANQTEVVPKAEHERLLLDRANRDDAYLALEARVESLRAALGHYADERNWLNRSEFRAFPGEHGNAVARSALAGEGDSEPTGVVAHGTIGAGEYIRGKI